VRGFVYVLQLGVDWVGSGWELGWGVRGDRLKQHMQVRHGFEHDTAPALGGEDDCQTCDMKLNIILYLCGLTCEAWVRAGLFVSRAPCVLVTWHWQVLGSFLSCGIHLSTTAACCASCWQSFLNSSQSKRLSGLLIAALPDPVAGLLRIGSAAQ